MSGSRTSWGTLAIATAGYLLYLAFWAERPSAGSTRRRLKDVGTVTAVIVLVASLAAFGWPRVALSGHGATVQPRVESLSGLWSGDREKFERAVTYRLSIWETGLNMWSAHWLNGVGPRGFQYAYTKHNPEKDYYLLHGGSHGSANGRLISSCWRSRLKQVLSDLLGYLILATVFLRSLVRLDRASFRSIFPFALMMIVALFPFSGHMAFYGVRAAGLIWWIIIANACAFSDCVPNGHRRPPRRSDQWFRSTLDHGVRRFSRTRHVAVLSPTLAGGGAERKALFIAAGLLERGHEVDILVHRLVCHYPDEVPRRARLFYLSSRGDGETRGILDRLAVVPQPLFPERTPWRARLPRTALLCKVRGKQLPLLMSTRPPRWAAGIAAYVDREHPSALLAMNVLAVTATTMAASLVRHPTKVVGTLHDVLRSGRLLERARRSYPFADFAVGVSRGTTAELEGIPGMARDRIHTIYNPVVSADLDRKARESPHHPWFDDRPCPVILAIGRMRKVKDFSTLLRAFARLLDQRPARLIVLGEGRLRPALRSLAQELGIAEQVDFPGFKENPYAFLAKGRPVRPVVPKRSPAHRPHRGHGLRLSGSEHRLSFRPPRDTGGRTARSAGAGGRRGGPCRGDGPRSG